MRTDPQQLAARSRVKHRGRRGCETFRLCRPSRSSFRLLARNDRVHNSRIGLDSCRGDSRVGCGKLAIAVYVVFVILACVLHPCLCPPVSQKLDGVTSSSRSGAAHRAASDSRCSAENRARDADTAAKGAAGVPQGTVTTTLVDTRLRGKPRTFSGALADWKPWRFTFTAYARAPRPDMKSLMERAVAAATHGDILNVHLSPAD